MPEYSGTSLVEHDEVFCEAAIPSGTNWAGLEGLSKPEGKLRPEAFRHAVGVAQNFDLEKCTDERAWPMENVYKLEPCSSEFFSSVCAEGGESGVVCVPGAIVGLLVRAEPNFRICIHALYAN